MKKLISIFVIALFIFGCGEKKEDKKVEQKDKYTFDTSDVKTTPVENPDQSFLLRYTPEKDKKYHYRITTLASDNQTIEADTIMTQKMKQSVVYLLDMELKNVDNDSTMEFNCNFNSIKVDADVNGKKFNYQSGVTPDSLSKKQFSDYVAILNSPFSVRVSKLGEILEIFRADKIVSAYIDMKGLKDSLNATQKESVRQNLIDAGLKPLLLLVFRKVPQQTVAKDSTWAFQQPESQFMIYKINSTAKYKVADLEQLDGNKLATINAGIDTKVTGNDKITERGVTYNFTKPESKARGKIFFNISKGLIQKSRTKTELKVHYTMEMQGPRGLQKGSKSEVIVNTNISELL